jgi:threonine dehydrogenase-like Zn-dependent dehydrogenase
MDDRSAKYRAFYAQLICAAAKTTDPRIEQAFRNVRREPFAGPGPWSISFGGHPYVVTPDDDPAFLYQNALLALRERSGIASDLPDVDVIYVCAGAAQPATEWLEALRAGGRLVFPLAPEGMLGGMLMITRPEQGTAWPAKFLGRAQFIGCAGLQDADAGKRLAEAFAKGWESVQSLHRGDAPDDTCWFAGDGWWLSTAPASVPAVGIRAHADITQA